MSNPNKRPYNLPPNQNPNKRQQRLSQIGMDRLQVSGNTSLQDYEGIGPQRPEPPFQQHARPTTSAAVAAQSSIQQQLPQYSAVGAQQQQPYMDMEEQHTVRRPSAIFNRSLKPSALEKFEAAATVNTTFKKFEKDPRDIKSADTQRKYLKAITDYLKETGYNGVAPPRHYRELGSRDFQSMFKYLTQRILPDFKFQKKFEEDIFEVMKLLKYPFIDSISPKSLLSIGALHSNPSFFGLLHYMVGICKVNDGLNKTPQDMTLSQPSSRTSVVSYSGGGDPITSGQLFHEYSVDTYHAFMAGENDFTEQTEKLKQVFANMNRKNKEIVEQQRLKKTQLERKLAELTTRESKLKTVQKRNQDLKRDISSTKKYTEKKREKLTKYGELNNRIKVEIKNLEERIRLMQQDINRMRQILQQRNTSEQEILKVENQRSQLQEKANELEAQVQQMKQLFSEKESRTVSIRHEIDGFITKYNKFRDFISTITTTNDNQQHNLPKIEFNSQGQTQIQVLGGVDLDNEVTPFLKHLRQDIKQGFETIADEMFDLRERSALLKQEVIQKKNELKLLDERLNTRNAVLEQKQIKTYQEIQKYNDEIDADKEETEKLKSDATNLVHETRKKAQDQKKLLEEKKKTVALAEKDINDKYLNACNLIDSKLEKMSIQADELKQVADEQVAKIASTIQGDEEQQ